MSGRSSKGFTLVEILVVIAIIGILMTLIAPNIAKLMLPRRKREVFLSKLNILTRYAWQHALVECKVHKVSVDFEKKLVWVEMATGVIKDNQPEFARIKGAYISTTLAIPSNILIKNFIIEGYDEMSRSAAGQTKESWFFIMPDGLTQMVTINFFDTQELTPAGKPRQFGLVLNPFNAQFKVYDSFQK